MSSAIRSASPIMCVESRMVRPSSFSSLRRFRTSTMLTGSSPDCGSSRMMSSGSCRRVPMSWTFCWLPFESSSTLASFFSPSSNLSSHFPIFSLTAAPPPPPPRPLDDARVGQKDAGDHADGGGLPRPIPPEQPGDGPPPHGEGDPIHRPHGPKRLDYVPNRQNHGHAPPPRRRNRGVLYAGRGSGFGGIQDRIVEWQWNKDLHELMNDPIDLTYKPIA